MYFLIHNWHGNLDQSIESVIDLRKVRMCSALTTLRNSVLVFQCQMVIVVDVNRLS